LSQTDAVLLGRTEPGPVPLDRHAGPGPPVDDTVDDVGYIKPGAGGEGL